MLRGQLQVPIRSAILLRVFAELAICAVPFCAGIGVLCRRWLAGVIVGAAMGIALVVLIMLYWLFRLDLVDLGVNKQPFRLWGVPAISLSPTEVAVPSVRAQLARNDVVVSSRYAVRSGDLFFVAGGLQEKVVGDVPPSMSPSDINARSMTDVASPSGITTYLSYVEYKSGMFSPQLARSDLYAISGNNAQRILPNVRPGGLNRVDKQIALKGAYLDKRGLLYVATMDGMLCAIHDGRVIGKVDLGTLGVKAPAIPSIFSDAENTYLLVPKDGTVHVGVVSESDIRSKYKLELAGDE